MQQINAREQEAIFERPLDPCLQENSDSELPSNAKLSIVTSDSNVVRRQEQQYHETSVGQAPMP